MLKANLTALLAKISKLPLEQISAGLVDAIASANQMLKDAQTVVERADGLVVDLNAQVKPLADSVLGVSTDASQMLQEARKRLELRDGEPMQNLNVVLLQSRKLVDDLNRDLPRLIGPMVQALTKTTATLDQAQALVVAAQRFVSPGSPIYFELTSALDRIQIRRPGNPRLRGIYPAQSQRLADRQQITPTEADMRLAPPSSSPAWCCWPSRPAWATSRPGSMC